jgi:membrane-bound serine protease (ClpP class)
MTTFTAIILIVALMAVGMVLLIAEVAIIPGFGVAGISAAALIIGGAAFAGSRFGATWGMGSLLLSAVGAYAILKIVPRTRAGKSLVLSTELKKGAVDDKAQELLGREGKTLTALRPAGAAEIDGRRLDVVTDGVFVEAGRPVRVVTVEGARIVVAPIS